MQIELKGWLGGGARPGRNTGVAVPSSVVKGLPSINSFLLMDISVVSKLPPL